MPPSAPQMRSVRITPAVTVQMGKARRRYGNDRVDDLVNHWEGRLRRRFRDLVQRILDASPIATLTRMINEGRVEEAIDVVGRAATQLAAETTGAYIASGKDVGQFLDNALAVVVDFDQVNPRAVRWIEENRLRLIREFGNSQREAVREAVRQGILDGANPIEQARNFRGAIGLTQRQVRAVNNFKKLLQNRSAQALTRKLRDRRFDSSVIQHVRGDRVLTPDKIERMVSRYRERYLKYRANTIARTEAAEAVHAGNEEMFRQAIDSGDVQAEQLTRTWHTARDERVRGSHRDMHRQKRQFNTPFLSGLGNELRFPLDPNAPPEDRIQCRCSVATELVLGP